MKAQVLKIFKNNDDILRKKCQKIDKIDQSIKNLVDNMWATLLYHGGRGLSANQVGYDKRIMIILGKKFKDVLINPEISSKSKKTFSFREGCLSLPNIYKDIKARNKKIKVSYLSLTSEKKECTLSNIDSVIFQHELDHLNGILLTDY